MSDFLHEPVPDECKPGEPVEPVRAVEIVAGGSERREVGGAIVEATLPPVATAEEVIGTEATVTVTVCENVVLPAGGLVEMQYGVAVPLEVLDESTYDDPVYDGPVVAEGCTQTFTPRLARDDPALPVDGQRRRVKARQDTEAAADALAALPVNDSDALAAPVDEERSWGSASPEDPLFAADAKDDDVEAAPVAAARPISEEEAVEKRYGGRSTSNSRRGQAL